MEGNEMKLYMREGRHTWRYVADSDMKAIKNESAWGFEVETAVDTDYRVEFTDAELRRCVEATDSER